MTEDDDMSDDQKKKAIEELMEKSRSGLDEMALKYGINPVDMPNKSVVAEAIYNSEAFEKKGIETSDAEYASVSEREGGEQIASPDSVSSYKKEGKIKASGGEIEEMVEKKETSVKGYMQDQRDLFNEYRDYQVQGFNPGVKLIKRSVLSNQLSINNQMKKNREYVQKEFAHKTKNFNESVLLYQKSIQKKIKENDLYLKQTYLKSLAGYRNEIRQTVNKNQTYFKMDFAKALLSFNDTIFQFRKECEAQIQENRAFRDAFYG